MITKNTVPTTKSVAKIYTKIGIRKADVIPDEKAKIWINFFAADDTIIGVQSFELIGEEYTAWGSDDNYLLDKAVEKLNIVLP